MQGIVALNISKEMNRVLKYSKRGMLSASLASAEFTGYLKAAYEMGGISQDEKRLFSEELTRELIRISNERWEEIAE